MRRLFVLLTLAGGWTAPTAGCAPAPPAPVQPAVPDAEVEKYFNKNLKQYIAALLLCGSPLSRDWDEARRQFEVLHPFFFFREDPELIRQFRAGSESARKELARRGVILRSVMIFNEKYDKSKWTEARLTLMETEPGRVVLVTTLLKMLLNGLYRDIWMHVRFELVECGPMALETAVGLAKELVNVMPGSTPVFKGEDLTQILLVLISFGDAGQPHLQEFSRSEKRNVRRMVARAIGEAVDGASAPVLIRLLSDPEWEVRTAAAESMGRMAPARAQAGPALVARITQERDALVLRAVLRAIGDLFYADAVPDLMRVLEVPSRETAEVAMSALYIITGERFLRRELWQDWYRTKYPDWKARRAARPK